MSDSVEDEVRAAVERRASALASGDAAALEAVLHPGFRWTSHRGEMFDRDAYVQSNTSGRLVWRRQEVSFGSVVVVGDAAAVTCVVTDVVEAAGPPASGSPASGSPASFRMPVTQTWVRVAGRWLCLAGHAGPAF